MVFKLCRDLILVIELKDDIERYEFAKIFICIKKQKCRIANHSFDTIDSHFNWPINIELIMTFKECLKNKQTSKIILTISNTPYITKNDMIFWFHKSSTV